ncbi:ABC transporter permease subunit [Bacillus spongiae]|uniref:ABC transporter permease subunit n=1 Tax=Bacillus spongiae TaxID=2683610 RepID=A0ABU8HL03_9BACI
MRFVDRNKLLIIICIIFILSLLSGSIILNYFYDGKIPRTSFLTDDLGKVISAAPFAPSLSFPFGTDRNGYDMFFKVLQGAQYTLGAAIIISLLSFAISFIVGVIGGFRNTKLKAVSNNIFTAFYFIPQSIIAYNILYPLLWEPYEGFTTTFTERLIWQVIVIALITVPTTAILIANEIKLILQKEFITSAKVLGGRNLFLLQKHVLPHLKLQLFMIFPKIIIQVLLIIAHLGFFLLFFGGTNVCYGPYCDPPSPIVQEWSGLMAMNLKELTNAWWIFMAPMIFFTLTILSLNGITKGLQGVLKKERKLQMSSIEQRKEQKEVIDIQQNGSENKFEFTS